MQETVLTSYSYLRNRHKCWLNHWHGCLTYFLHRNERSLGRTLGCHAYHSIKQVIYLNLGGFPNHYANYFHRNRPINDRNYLSNSRRLHLDSPDPTSGVPHPSSHRTPSRISRSIWWRHRSRCPWVHLWMRPSRTGRWWWWGKEIMK